MKTSTQVWLFCSAICFLFLAVGFHFGNRSGLFLAFVICLIFLYFILHKGEKKFILLSQATEISGSDRHGFKNLLVSLIKDYGFTKLQLYYTSKNLPPLIWPKSNNHVVIILNETTIESFNLSERIILAHWLLCHARENTKLARHVLSLLAVAMSPFDFILLPFFWIGKIALRFSREIYRADLKAYKNSGCSSHEFSLFLRKLHLLDQHTLKIIAALYCFSGLTPQRTKRWAIYFHPRLPSRLKNIIGYSY